MFEQLKNIDRDLLLTINSHNSPILDTILWGFSSTIPTVLLVLLFAYFFFKKFGEKKVFGFIVGAMLVFALADSSSHLVKNSIKRYRPTHNVEIKSKIHKVNNYEGGQYGFFSGHSANTFGLTVFVFLCAKWIRLRIKLLFFFYPLIVVYSRMYLGVHYPSDIMVGMIDGIFFGFLVYYLLNKFYFKFNEKQIIAS